MKDPLKPEAEISPQEKSPAPGIPGNRTPPPAKKKLRLDVEDVSEVLERKISP